MTAVESLFSRVGAQLSGSAIRQMGNADTSQPTTSWVLGSSLSAATCMPNVGMTFLYPTTPCGS
jgi:hypothetical protein